MTSDPSTISGVLGLVAVFVLAVVLGLMVEWISEKDEQ